jgi:hypothetical protein
MLSAPLSIHAAGTFPSRTAAHVELDDERRYVTVTLDPEPGETFDDRAVTRYLTADEAREIAAALVHYAGELERR